jgi:hypothetical protein
MRKFLELYALITDAANEFRLKVLIIYYFDACQFRLAFIAKEICVAKEMSKTFRWPLALCHAVHHGRMGRALKRII